jgi:hypothetical protein
VPFSLFFMERSLTLFSPGRVPTGCGTSVGCAACLNCCAVATLTTSAPFAFSARPKALRIVAFPTHSRVGCTQAPRPGRAAESSTTTSPFRATTLIRDDLSARVRQPRQVLTGSILTQDAPLSLRGSNPVGCRCVRRLVSRPGGRSGPPCRWPATAGNPARGRAPPSSTGR